MNGLLLLLLLLGFGNNCSSNCSCEESCIQPRERKDCDFCLNRQREEKCCDRENMWTPYMNSSNKDRESDKGDCGCSD